MTTAYDPICLRTTPLFDVGRSTDLLTLPQLLHALWHDDTLDWVDVRPHQRQAWHLFLVQLATLGASQATCAPEDLDEDGWRDALLALAHGEESAWHLVVEPGSREQGFMQPAMGTHIEPSDYKKVLLLPAELDVLIDTKNQDNKRPLHKVSRPIDWLLALITLQTTQGVFGAGNYGVARINGGYGHRPYVTLLPKEALTHEALRVRHDVRVALAQRALDPALKAYASTCALMWTVPWSKGEPLDWWSCDAHVIEICRRVRIERHPDTGALYARVATSKCARAHNSGIVGITHDPWSPTTTQEVKPGQRKKLLTLGEHGIMFKHVPTLLCSAGGLLWDAPFSLGPHGVQLALSHGDDTFVLYFEHLARGQGKLSGYVRQSIPVPRLIVEGMALQGDARAHFDEIVKLHISWAWDFIEHVLLPSVLALDLHPAHKARQIVWLKHSMLTPLFEAIASHIHLEQDETPPSTETRLTAHDTHQRLMYRAALDGLKHLNLITRGIGHAHATGPLYRAHGMLARQHAALSSPHEDASPPSDEPSQMTLSPGE